MTARWNPGARLAWCLGKPASSTDPSPIPPVAAEPRLRIGVSSCLLGQEVRWDGGHKHVRFLTAELESFVEWVPVCPEVEVGMGVPREPVLLASDGSGVWMVGESSGRDHTSAMLAFCARRLAELRGLELRGYVLKARSPSCGPGAVPIVGAEDESCDGRGMFAEALLQALPRLPVVDDETLQDIEQRDAWLRRVRAYRP